MEALFDRAYVLSDSLSDNGNFFSLSDGTFPTTPFFYPGRFSDGYVWVDYFGESLELSIAPFFDNNADIANSDIVNFAVGGATSGNENISPIPVGFAQQVDSLENLLTIDPPSGVIEDDLFLTFIGANDFLSFIEDNPETPDIIETNFPKNTKSAVQVVVNNISSGFQDIIDLGGENIVVLNLPNLGEIPLGLSLTTKDSNTLNKLTKEFNKALDKSIKLLEKSNEDVNFIEIDLNFLFSDMTKNPEDYGFTNVTEGYTLTDLYGGVLDATPTNPGDDPSTYLFHDSAHPTTVGHNLISSYVIEELTANNLVI